MADETGPRLMAALVVRGPFEAAILPRFTAGTGRTAAVDWQPTTVIMRELAAGARADAVIVTKAAMDELVAAGRVDPASRVEVVRSRVGLAVAAGAPHPDIATPEAFTRALLAARSVAYSAGGASGIHFRSVLERLGLTEAIDARATIIPAGFTAEKLVTGEADLAVQQISELMVVPGIEVVGAFPDAVQQVSAFSAALLHGAEHRDDAARLLALLRGPEAEAAYRAGGLDPVEG